MKNKILLIIGIIVVIILVAYFLIEAKYIKAIDEDGKKYILKEGDSIYKDELEITILDIQSEKVVVIESYYGEQYECIYGKEYKFKTTEGWLEGIVSYQIPPSVDITFEKNIF